MAVAHPFLSDQDVAACAAADADQSDDAYEAAYRDLIGALARALRALRIPPAHGSWVRSCPARP